MQIILWNNIIIHFYFSKWVTHCITQVVWNWELIKILTNENKYLICIICFVALLNFPFSRFQWIFMWSSGIRGRGGGLRQHTIHLIQFHKENRKQHIEREKQTEIKCIILIFSIFLFHDCPIVSVKNNPPFSWHFCYLYFDVFSFRVCHFSVWTVANLAPSKKGSQSTSTIRRRHKKKREEKHIARNG